MTLGNQENKDIHFKRINADMVLDICKMSETLPIEQKKCVVDNALSIAQALFSENVWMRAIYAEGEPIGFALVSSFGD